MERPNILNIPDFFIIGLMVIAFFLMLRVIGEAIVYFTNSRHPTSSGASNGS